MENYIYTAVKDAESRVRQFQNHFATSMSAQEFHNTKMKWLDYCNQPLTRLKTCPRYLVDQNSRIFDYAYEMIRYKTHTAYIWEGKKYSKWNAMPEPLRDHVRLAGYDNIVWEWVWTDSFCEEQDV